MRLKGGRTGKRAVVCEDLELTGLMKPFDLEVWYGERVAVLGSNGSGKSHFLRLLAAGGSDPDVEHRPVDDVADRAGRPHRQGQARRAGAPGLVRADPRAPRAASAAPCWRSCTAATSTATGWAARQAARVLDRYELAHAAEQRFESLSGGQQARFQILLLELSGATLLLLDEPTDNLDVQSAEALEDGPRGLRGHGASRSPTTAGSPAASTGSWSTAPTARSTSPTARSGTRAGCSAPDERPRDRRRSTRSTRPPSTPWHDVYLAAEQAERATSPSPLACSRRCAPRCRTRAPDAGTAAGRARLDGRVVVAGLAGTCRCSTTSTAPTSTVHVVPDAATPRPRRPRCCAGSRRRRRERGRTLLNAEAAWPYAAGSDGTGQAGPRVRPAASATRWPWATSSACSRCPSPDELLDDLAAEAAPHHAAYTLRSWAGPVPDDLARRAGRR